MRLTSRCWPSTVWSRIVNRSFVSLRAAIADGRPVSRYIVTLGVVFYIGSTPRAARIRVLSTIPICQLFLILTKGFRAMRLIWGPLVRPLYHASIL
jgi:hypothetical protein